MPEQKIKNFRSVVYKYYRKHRRIFPWRNTTSPYHILVSEIMLQQTHVSRVEQKYSDFIRTFPTAQKLARAQLSLVLRAWSGLGYNRRALYLQRTAKLIVKKNNGKIPADQEILASFPGIGPNTAGAILAFAFNKPAVFIETNIRSVFIHHLASRLLSKVSDRELFPLVALTLDPLHSREWYSALMDYGAHLKKTLLNPSHQSKHHAVQTPFKGSNRECRGKALRALLKHKNPSQRQVLDILK